jgi:antitoxin ParD1/3/4
MNISLTEDLKSFVDARIKSRGYSSVSEYMRDLVRRDEERLVEERFKSLIEDGMASESAGEWEDLRGQFLTESGLPAPSKAMAKRQAARTHQAA